MVQREVIVRNSFGIHMRPAAMITKAAMSFQSSIWLEKDGIAADAKSIMAILMLGAAQDSKIKICAHGVDEQEALETIVSCFEKNFNQEQTQ